MTPIAPPLASFPWAEALPQWVFMVLMACLVLAACDRLRGGGK
jgi:hypothetical protein